MKSAARGKPLVVLAGWILGAYIRIVLATVRWRHVNLECVEPVLAGDGGAVALLWHGRIPIGLAVAPQWWRKHTRALISPSADGEFVARALAMNGFPAIRMSTAKKGANRKARQAVAAFREAIAHVQSGGVLIVTPDGPRGPNEVIAPGALQIARRAGAPIFLMGIAARPAIRLNTWDKVMFGLPFGRGAVVWVGPLHVPSDADEPTIESLIAAWSARLSEATRTAEAMVGGRQG